MSFKYIMPPKIKGKGKKPKKPRKQPEKKSITKVNKGVYQSVRVYVQDPKTKKTRNSTVSNVRKYVPKPFSEPSVRYVQSAPSALEIAGAVRSLNSMEPKKINEEKEFSLSKWLEGEDTRLKELKKKLNIEKEEVDEFIDVVERKRSGLDYETGFEEDDVITETTATPLIDPNSRPFQGYATAQVEDLGDIEPSPRQAVNKNRTMNEIELRKLTKPELKDYASKRNISVAGTMSDIIERIIQGTPKKKSGAPLKKATL